jgi:hypothetical protein
MGFQKINLRSRFFHTGDFLKQLHLILLKNFVFSKNVKKLNEGINYIDFSSNINFAKKSLAKVIDHRIEKPEGWSNVAKIDRNGLKMVLIEPKDG